MSCEEQKPVNHNPCLMEYVQGFLGAYDLRDHKYRDLEDGSHSNAFSEALDKWETDNLTTVGALMALYQETPAFATRALELHQVASQDLINAVLNAVRYTLIEYAMGAIDQAQFDEACNQGGGGE